MEGRGGGKEEMRFLPRGTRSRFTKMNSECDLYRGDNPPDRDRDFYRWGARVDMPSRGPRKRSGAPDWLPLLYIIKILIIYKIY